MRAIGLMRLSVALGLVTGQIIPSRGVPDSVDSAVERAVQFLDLYQNADGSWSGPLDIIGTELNPADVTPFAIASLLWAGAPADGDSLEQSLDWLKTQLGEDRSTQSVAWSTIALSLANEAALAKKEAERLEQGRLPGGGWVYYPASLYLQPPANPDLIPTAMALIALAYAESGQETWRQVDLRWLESGQNTDGGWGADGTSYAEETALAALTLGLYGRTQQSLQALKWLESNQNGDGSWPSPEWFPRTSGLADAAWATIALSLLSDDPATTVEAGQRFIVAQQQPTGHWGQDLETTITALAALSLTPGPTADHIQRWLVNHLILEQLPDGHWSDYSAQERVKLNQAFLSPSVAPALLQNLIQNGFEDEERDRLSKEYQAIAEFRTTLAALQALVASGRRSDSPGIGRATQWVLNQQLEDGSWFRNAGLTIDTVLALQDTGLDPNTPALRQAVAFTRQTYAFDIASPLIRPMRLSGVPTDDAGLSRYLLETLARQKASGAIIGELPYADPERGDPEDTAHYLATLVDLNAPQENIDRALAFVLAQQSPLGDWEGNLYSTMSVVHSLSSVGMAPEAVQKAREWLLTQRDDLVFRYDEQLDIWPMYIEATGNKSLLESVPLTTPRNSHETRQHDSTVPLSGPPGGGPTIEATANLIRAVLPKPPGLTLEPISVAAVSGQEVPIILVAEAGEVALDGEASAWLSISRDEMIGGRRLIVLSLAAPEAAPTEIHWAGLRIGNTAIPISIQMASIRPSLNNDPQFMNFIVFAVIAAFIVCRWRFGPESMSYGLIWGTLRTAGTYIVIIRPLPITSVGAVAMGVMLIAAALVWQVRIGKSPERWPVAVAGGVVAATIESALMATTAPWPPEVLLRGYFLNVVWSAAIGFVSSLRARARLGLALAGLALPFHLVLMGRIYPPYYDFSLWSSIVTYEYPIPWTGIPLFAVSAYFYLAVGALSLSLALGAETMARRASKTETLPEPGKPPRRLLFATELVAGISMGLLLFHLINASKIWLVDQLDQKAWMYLIGLCALLVMEMTSLDKVFTVARNTLVFWTISTSIVFTSSFKGFASFADLWDFFEQLFVEFATFAALYKLLILPALFMGSRLLPSAAPYLNAGLRRLATGTRMTGQLLKRAIDTLADRLTRLINVLEQGLGRLPLFKRWLPSPSVRETESRRPSTSAKLRELSDTVRTRIAALVGRLSAQASRLQRSIEKMNLPQVRQLGRVVLEVTASNLILNLVLLGGFWLDTLGPDWGRITSVVKLFEWNVSNPFISQFLLLETVTIAVCLAWWLVTPKLDPNLKWYAVVFRPENSAAGRMQSNSTR